MRPYFYAILAVLVGFLAFPARVRADGIIIPDPPICDPGPCPPQPFPIAQLQILYHKVTVNIENQVAVTRVDQVFYNPNDWAIEGTYMFPIPPDAAISSFTLWVDGEPVQGEVLEAGEARARYEEIVRTLRDPALLEYAGSGAWLARIFPISPKSDRRVELEYSQVLVAEGGLVKYTYPLSTEKFSMTPLEQVSVRVSIRSQTPIRAVYSPTHSVDISKDSDTQVKVGYEENNVLPDRDFALYYSIGQAEAFHLLTYRDPSDEYDSAGFFLVLLAPRPQAPSQALPKDVILVLDRSGSMDGEKFQQAQEALRFILKNLNAVDRFNIITFSTGIEPYAASLRPADEAKEALPWVDRLSARGNTDINRALLEAAALADESRPTYLIFLTDGLPTEGVTVNQEILANFHREAPQNMRLFAFGVGYDVDTFLLDSLAQENHGASAYVLPEESLDEKVSAFYEKISTPVLTDLVLDFGAAGTYEIYPDPLPDLFLGGQIIAVGRYRNPGARVITLSGKMNNETQTFVFDDQVFSKDNRQAGSALAALPRLWATRKIGYLLNQIRLNGAKQEMIDQIVRLSIRYGIVTPYTSYLVTEEVALGAEAQERLAEETFSDMQAEPAAPAFGQAAVQKAADEGAYANAQSALAPDADSADVVRIVGARTFVLQEGIWIDTGFDPQRMPATPVAFLSDDYFRLVAAYPELGAAFGLGSQVIALADGTAYQVVAEGENVPALPDLPTRVPASDIQTAPDIQTASTPAEAEAQATPIAQVTKVAQGKEATPTLQAQEVDVQPAATPQPVEPKGISPLCAGLLMPLASLILLRKRKG